MMLYDLKKENKSNQIKNIFNNIKLFNLNIYFNSLL